MLFGLAECEECYYVERKALFTSFRINEIPLIHFKCSMLGNDVNFKVFSEDDDNNDDD